MKYFLATSVFAMLYLAMVGLNDEYLPSEYVEFLQSESSGLSKTIEMCDCHFRLLYKPVDYLVCNELRSNRIAKSEYERLKENFGDAIYVDLSYSCLNHDGVAREPELLQVLEHDTIRPSLSHSEATGGISGKTTELYIFPGSRDFNDLLFLLKCGGQSRVLKIAKYDLENLPKLKTHS